MEDLLYRFVWQPDWDGPLERIGSLADVLRSQQIHYWSGYCGRFIVHSVAQVLLNLVPEELTKLLNAAMFLLMIVLVTKITNTPKELRAVTAALTFTMIFVLMQGFRMGFIWIIGAFNYLWPMVINMVFILTLRARSPIALPLAIIAGGMHEALSLPVSIALLYWLFRQRRETNLPIYCVLAYIMGLMTLLLSPALWHRVEEDSVTLQQRLLAGPLNLVLNVRISWLLFIILAIHLHRGTEVFLGSVRANRYILTAWIAAMGIVLACGETLERVASYVDFLAMLALLRIWQEGWLRRYKTVTVCIAMAIAALMAVLAIALNRENHENYLYHCNQLQTMQAETPDSHIIKIRQFSDHELNELHEWLGKRYVYPNVEFGFTQCYMPFDSQDLETRCVARLFNKESIIMLPEDVVNKIETDTAAYTHWEADSNEKLFIWRLQPSQQVSCVVFELGDEVPLPFYKRWTTYPDDEFELDSFKYEVITLKGNDYLVMTIPMNKVKRRIRGIKLSR
jgi:hypothetical protein